MPFEPLVLPEKITAADERKDEAGRVYYTKFVAEPYESGFGHTVGNSLRRILLSSLDGAAVTAVRIEGAVHEYQTLPGVREDVINILLNLKKLRIKMSGRDTETVFLSATKHGEVKASSIKEVDGVEVVNKDLVIAHIEPGGKLEAELEITKGRGYVAAEELARKQRPASFIPVDSLFSPVIKVHYDVEPARVGQKTDYDRLVLEVTTDGTIEPKDALQQSATILAQSLHIFTPEGEKAAEAAAASGAAADEARKPATELRPDLEDLLNQPLDLVELSSRSANCLKAAKVRTVRDLVLKTDEELKAIKNFGTKSLDEIKEKLTEMGLSLGMKV